MKTISFLTGISLLCGSWATAHPQGRPHSKKPYTPPNQEITLGEGAFTYRNVVGWAQQNRKTHPIGHGHAMVEDSKGRLYLVNSSKKTCVVVLSAEGTVLDTWGDFCTEAHGLSLVKEGDKEVLFIADSGGNGQVVKTTLDGKILKKWTKPEESGLYQKDKPFKPSKTMHLPDGSFYIIDGYGSDYIHRYDARGKYVSSFGGDIGEGEAQLKHWGPHGGAIDFTNPDKPTILLALSDQQKLKRFNLDGKHLETIPMKGGNPRDILFSGEHVFIPHLGDDWPGDRTSPGVISVHDRKTLKLICTLGGRVDAKRKHPYQHAKHAFLHPHGIMISKTGDLYIAQYASGDAYPLKLVRVKK